ncbi:phosphatidylserine decarboxylase family protein [Hyalangium sp.]|uniref:phosphatidylserine decarboxylase family protein n=1 Tax=Hyalangium sp. TaxID=2028555 RepID=UPI002D79A836|nr:phosphatidylserine decarboxylase family protein [Hyalangium sp.]
MIEVRYQRLFGYRAGYLPRDRRALDEWLRSLKNQLRYRAAERRPSAAVRKLKELIDANAIVRMYVAEMLEQVPSAHKVIENTDELLAALDHIAATAPLYNPDPNKRNAFPMSSLFAYMMMTRAGEAVFRNDEFNRAIKNILQEWCQYLDSPESAHVLNEGEYGWLSQFAYQDMKLYEFIFDRTAPHWGWKSYNDFFHREIRKDARPITAPHDPKVIVSANDGNLVTIARGVQRTDTFWLKGEPYSLADMLDRSEHVDRFVGGYVFQSFLSGANYHRWHSPIDGVVRDARVVNGLMFSEAESAGFDPSAGILSEGYDACVNTRGLVFIESPDPKIGMVCVIPIGITEISSVTIKVKAGDRLTKGDELGYFSYGGSSMCLVFQPGSIDHFTVPAPPPLPVVDPTSGPAIQVNAQIAIAN